MISDVYKQDQKKVQAAKHLSIWAFRMAEWFRMKWWCILNAKCYVDDQHRYNIIKLTRMKRNATNRNEVKGLSNK